MGDLELEMQESPVSRSSAGPLEKKAQVGWGMSHGFGQASQCSGLSFCGAWTLGVWASVVAAPGI